MDESLQPGKQVLNNINVIIQAHSSILHFFLLLNGIS